MGVVIDTGIEIGKGITIKSDEPELAWGESTFTTPGTYTWTCPEDVTSVCVVCVGGGGSGSAGYNNGYVGPGQYKGGGGGGLGWKNNIAVTPGQTYTVVVGAGGVGVPADTRPPTVFYGYAKGNSGGNSYFINTSTVMGIGGAGGGRSGDNYANSAGGGFVGDGGGTGGFGGYILTSGPTRSSPGGGAGGYTGNGGDLLNVASGGGGAGGGIGATPGGPGNPGGGVGIYGEGTRGIDDISLTQGGVYGGGGGGSQQGSSSNGGDGAVRIIWGNNRSFPSATTNTEFLQGNRKLVTANLQVHMDFGEKRSYFVGGYGLAFYNILSNGGAPSGADGTNNTTYSEDYGGVINFPPTDPGNSYYFQYIGSASPPTFHLNSDVYGSPQPLSTTRKTFQLWLRFNTNITNNTVICAYADGGTGSNTYGYAIHAYANNAIAFRYRPRSYSVGVPYSVVYSSTDTIKPNNWYFITLSGIVSSNANSTNIWLNDDPTPVISLAIGDDLFNGSNSFFISDNYFSNAVAGNITVGGLFAYDKELSHAERVQNYEATKNRFLYSS